MEKIKKSASILIIFCMLISMLPVSVFAETTIVADGSCGESVYWSLDSNGVLTISGQGAMTNYTSSGSNAFAPWYEYRNNIYEVRVESGVTSIGNYAFNYYYPSIKRVSISDTVTYIGDQTFCYCSGITDINIPDSVTEIDWYAFYGCASLETIELSSGLSMIEAHTFDSCTSLKSILIPESIMTIDGTAFENCSSLTTIYGLTGSHAENWANENNYVFVSRGTIDNPAEDDDSTTELLPDAILGTKDNPYQIATAEDLNAVRNDMGAYYVQVCDIDLSGYENWAPIGSSDDVFAGVYDGSGFSISGLSIVVNDSNTANGFIGLFGKATGCIKNVNLTDSEIVTTVCCDYVGSICGYAKEIVNCNSDCTVDANCYRGGGIVGYAETITASAYKGTAKYTGTGTLYWGGVCGFAEQVDSCYNGGNISCHTYYTSTSPYLGGIAGYSNYVEKCCNSGELSGIASGKNEDVNIGGIVGLSGRGTIEDCYNYGNLTGDGYVVVLGGIAGYGYDNCSYKRCYSKCELIENRRYSYVGGIVGVAGYTQWVTHCYWNDEYTIGTSGEATTSKINYTEGTVGSLTENQFKNRETFQGFDFDTVWEFGGGKSYPYPTLRAIDYSTIISPGTENDDDLKLSIAGLTINKKFEDFYIFLGDSHVYNMDLPNAALSLELNQIAVVDNDVISPADILWKSSDETVLKIISSGTEEDMYVNLRVEGLTEGTATLTATNPDGETLSFDVTVVKANTLAFTNIYDTKQYYSSGAFYSAASSISDSVEIFVQFENALIDGYPCKVETDLAKNVSNVEPITLTATVSGSDLSFDRSSYQNTYTTTYDPIKFDNCVYDILMLFPYDVDSYEAGTSYTVNLTLESDSFAEPIEETYSFTVYDAEKQRVVEHINFTNNSTYKVSKQNIYGTNMLELKDDPEYNWSVVTSLDFDNYYEIVLADLLVDMLDVYQVNTSIVPAVLKEWHGTYKSLLGDVTTMVNDSYSDVLDVSEMKIDKVLKVSKYTKASDGIYADDDVYQVVLDMFGNVGNVDKIQTFFAAVDDTKSAFSIVKLTGDLVKDFVAWGNSIAVLNAFVETDENFKQVFRQVANNIPDSEKKMKEAIEDYLNYSEDFAGQFSEIYDSFCDLGVDVALDTFDGIVGEKLWDWAAAKAIGWIGKIPISGGTATFSSTTAYASLTTAIGSVTTGISLGLCLSDLICDSSDKAAEMSKIIAMSEYAPYIIQALEYYEDNLYSAADNNAVDLFEKAFGLHQASQSYIMDHTVTALEVKGESILYQILGNDDYDRLVAEILVQKNAVDSMVCCGTLTTDTVVNNKKVIAIKCPVDVYVYSEDGSEVVCIINDELQFAGEGITVYIRDRAKYIALPTNQTYSVKIVATDTGTMDYIVQEFDEELQLHKTVEKQDVALVNGRLFVGEVAPQLGLEETSYALTYEGIMIGDMDNDGEISDWDAILLNRYLAGWDVTITPSAADVDGDGEVSDWDAIVLERYLAGWDVEITAN